jgi:ribonuclease T1
MSEKKNNKQSKPRTLPGLLAVLVALVLVVLGQNGTLPFGEILSDLTGQPAATENITNTAENQAMPVSQNQAMPAEGVEDAAEAGAITTPQAVADYIFEHGTLPDHYLTKSEARALGWDSSKNYVSDVAPGYAIGGDRFGNYEGLLPDADGRTWYEADVNYTSGSRGAERILYSSDGLVYYTNDHYQTFTQMFPSK